MHTNTKKLTKHLSAVTKRERRLQKLSERVATLDAIRSKTSFEITDSLTSPNMRKTRAKIADLMQAEKEFRQYANKGFPAVLQTMSSIQTGEPDDDQELTHAMKNATDYKDLKVNKITPIINAIMGQVDCADQRP